MDTTLKLDDGRTIIRLDAEDLDRVRAHAGWYQWPRSCSKVSRDTATGKMDLAGFVLGADGHKVMHLNGDKTDCRKANLRLGGKRGRPRKTAGTRATLSTFIETSQVQRLDAIAALLARSRSDLVEEAILEKLKQWEMIL